MAKKSKPLCGKVIFETKEGARTVALSLPRHTHVYRCAPCGGYHVGTNRKWTRKKKQGRRRGYSR